MVPEGFGQHDRAGHPAEGSVETQLADECHSCDRAEIQLPGRHQQPDGNREIEGTTGATADPGRPVLAEWSMGPWVINLQDRPHIASAAIGEAGAMKWSK